MENHPMSAESPNLPEAAVGDPFLEALAAGMPARGPVGFPIIVAVSGGADSVAMLIGLMKLGVQNLVVAHAEHDLRPEAPADREFVDRLARRFGLHFAWRRLAVRERGDEAAGEGLEARARRLRYDYLADVARERGARHVLVAHTADDQAETILHRILRGTGVAGLAGMRRARELGEGVALVRPMLGIPRAAGHAFLCRVAEHWQEDATNADTARTRNFLRHVVLPRCVDGPYPAAVASLLRLGTQAAGIADALASAAEHLLALHAKRRPDGCVLIQARDLVALDRHLLAELFAALWRREGWPRRDMTAFHYEHLATWLQAPDERSPESLPGAIRVEAMPDGIMAIGPRRQ